MNDERRRAVEVALQRMINQHPHIKLPELIAVSIENALSWPQMEIPAYEGHNPHNPDHPMKAA